MSSNYRITLPVVMACGVLCLLVGQARADVLEIYSDDSDGAVYGGTFPSQDLIVGAATGGNYNGIAIFELPDLQGQSLTSAALKLTVTQEGTLPGANIDIWGLGYLTGTPVIKGSWLLITDTETRDGNTLGTNIGTDLPTKIVDNFVTANTTVAVNDVAQTDVTSFVSSLYDTYGAQAGDYAVIRINADGNELTNNPGNNIRYGGSHRGTNAALLTVTTQPVPEPATWVLAALAMVAAVPVLRRRYRI